MYKYAGTKPSQVHISELNRSEIDLSQKLSECERSNANWNRSEIDLNESEIDLNESEIDLNESEIDLHEYEHFLKANQDRSEMDPGWIDDFQINQYIIYIYMKCGCIL